MFGIHHFELFLAAGILLNLTPGPDTAYILGRSIAQGREAGIASALGICVGSIFHTCAAALGLSAILATSAARIKFAVQFSPTHDDGRIPARLFDECAESESGAVLSGFSTAIHRPGIHREAAGLSHAWSHVCDDRHNLVPPTRLVRIRFQRTIARESDHYSLAQSRCRLTFCFPGSAPRNSQVTMFVGQCPTLVCAQFIVANAPSFLNSSRKLTVKNKQL